jgi:glycosyltransferase involved in cell wall biosynthesis
MLRPLALAVLAREERNPPLQFEHVICVSDATRSHLVASGVPVAQARVIHTGIDLTQFQRAREAPSEPGRLRLLYAGRLTSEKGLETALEAVAALVGESARHAGGGITLTIVGSGHSAYEEQLRLAVNQRGLADHVDFRGQVPHTEMPGLFGQFDVLLLPSIWPEPLSRVVLEGMAAGLVVVASTAGGTPEIVRHGINGLLFPPGDAVALADQIRALAADVPLRRGLAAAATQTVAEEFSTRRSLDRIERYLEEVAGGAPLAPRASRRTRVRRSQPAAIQPG